MRMQYVEGEDIGTYVSQMEDHFEKLAIAGQELGKDLKVNIVLSSLPDSFATLITALEGHPDADLTMEFVRGKLVDEATRRRSSSGAESALKTEFKRKPILCHFCQKPGHKRKDCRQWMEQQKAVEVNEKFVQKSRNLQKAKVAEKGSKEFAFLSRPGDSKYRKPQWIIDSGASCHMCNEESKFLDIDSSVVVEVTLADGKQIKSKGIGTCLMESMDEKETQTHSS
ncbi:uncharacterized protein LOC134210110 [Armigeres subalbatus]|uniref:uncharacterized protein LOC134210110 n=1 Tax=Armigeres subalbatus TaxID=124917 RepID=UPI002ED0E91E